MSDRINAALDAAVHATIQTVTDTSASDAAYDAAARHAQSMVQVHAAQWLLEGRYGNAPSGVAVAANATAIIWG